MRNNSVFGTIRGLSQLATGASPAQDMEAPKQSRAERRAPLAQRHERREEFAAAKLMRAAQHIHSVKCSLPNRGMMVCSFPGDCCDHRSLAKNSVSFDRGVTWHWLCHKAYMALLDNDPRGLEGKVTALYESEHGQPVPFLVSRIICGLLRKEHVGEAALLWVELMLPCAVTDGCIRLIEPSDLGSGDEDEVFMGEDDVLDMLHSHRYNMDLERIGDLFSR